MLLNNEDAKIVNESVETHRSTAISNYIFSSDFHSDDMMNVRLERNTESIGNFGVGFR